PTARCTMPNVIKLKFSSGRFPVARWIANPASSKGMACTGSPNCQVAMQCLRRVAQIVMGHAPPAQDKGFPGVITQCARCRQRSFAPGQQGAPPSLLLLLIEKCAGKID